MEETQICGNCEQLESEKGFEFPLCQRCRLALSQRPFPKWIVGTFVVVGLVLLFSLISFPQALEGRIAFERWQRAEASGDYVVAVTQYKQASNIFPGSTLIMARLGIAYYRSGQIQESRATLKTLSINPADKELTTEVKLVINEMNAKTAGQ